MVELYDRPSEVNRFSAKNTHLAGFKNLRFLYMELLQSNSVPGDQEEMWRYGNNTI